MAKHKAKVTHPKKGVAVVEFEDRPDQTGYYNSGDCPFKDGEEYDLDAKAEAEKSRKAPVKKAKK